MALLISDVIRAVRDTLAPVVEAENGEAQALDQLSDGLGTLPMLKLFASGGSQEPTRNTFGGGIQQTLVTIKATIYVRQRGNLADDYTESIALVDAFIDALQTQLTLDQPFGIAIDMDGFEWEWGDMKYADTTYSGISATMELRFG